MASARAKDRTLRQDFDEYTLTLAELLTAAGIDAGDIVAGERWRVRVVGDDVVLVRHRSPVVNPGQGGGGAAPLGRIGGL